MEVDVRLWQQLPEDHVIVQITAENRRKKRQRRVQPQGLNNVCLYVFGCRCSQSQTGNTRQASPQLTQLEIVGPEVMAPLGNAVGFVHSQVGQQTAGAKVRQAGLERRRGHHLWSDVEKLQLRAAAPQVSQDETALARRDLGVDGAGRDVELLQANHLVLCRNTGRTEQNSLHSHKV